MFTDVFVFDQARYLYDLLPTLSFFDKPFPIPFQLVLRVCMDAIRRHSWFGCSDLFWGSSLVSMGEEGFQNWSPPVRRSIACEEFESTPPFITVTIVHSKVELDGNGESFLILLDSSR